MSDALAIREPPSKAALAWCIAQVVPDSAHATVVAVDPLPGGLDAVTHRVTFDIGPRRQRVVMRRLFVADAQRVEHELAALRGLPLLEWPAVPRLLAADPGANHNDAPTFVISHLPGATNLSVAGSEDRARQMADALHTLHDALPRQLVGVPELTRFRIPSDERPVALPDSLPPVALLREAIETLPARVGTEQVIHADYHMGNVLFDGNRLRAVVDWGTARIGPREFDVAYCYMDLSLVFGEATALGFIEHYETLSGSPIAALPAWTLSAASHAYPDPAAWLPSWHAWGRDELTAEQVRARLANLVNVALAAL